MQPVGGHNMHADLRDLADIDHRLAEAVTQLHQQQYLVAGMDCEGRDREVSLRLLSNMLRQFRALEVERGALIQMYCDF
jgi:hypothetical protein